MWSLRLRHAHLVPRPIHDSLLTICSALQFRLTINDQDGLHFLYKELYRLGVFQNEDFGIDDRDDPYVSSKY